MDSSSILFSSRSKRAICATRRSWPSPCKEEANSTYHEKAPFLPLPRNTRSPQSDQLSGVDPRGDSSRNPPRSRQGSPLIQIAGRRCGNGLIGFSRQPPRYRYCDTRTRKKSHGSAAKFPAVTARRRCGRRAAESRPTGQWEETSECRRCQAGCRQTVSKRLAQGSR